MLFVTHSASEGDVRATLDGLGRTGVVVRVGSVMRIVGDRDGDRRHRRRLAGGDRGVPGVPAGVAATPVVTLLEGGRRCSPAPRLSARVGARVLLKVEGANPTGSFKDRGMTVAISKAAEEGAKAVVCASTGNTSASAAAFAARAGLTCAVLIPEGHIALGKLAQALIHGARVLQVRGQFRPVPGHRARARRDGPVTVVNSVNPYRIEGQKSGAFEIVDTLGDAPTSTASRWATPATSPPTGRGTSSSRSRPRPPGCPACWDSRPPGAAPIVEGHPIENPETVATAIRIGNPASWYGATSAASESGGGIAAVTDEEILEAYRFLATEESVFCEPASAASVAGLLKTGSRKGSEPDPRWSACSPAMA